MVAGSGLPVGLLHIFGGDCGGQFGVRDNAFGGGCRGEDRLMLAVVGSDPWSMVAVVGDGVEEVQQDLGVSGH